jgi:dinuclear metal center YbgI/SA1388 family protein
MKVKDVIARLEEMAPKSLQESYDNAGLLTGDLNMDVTGVLVSLDCIELVVEEAIATSCNVIVAHHPIIFKGLKSLTGKNYVERTIIKAIKNDIALYAIHTNLDNIRKGVNQKIADRLGLQNCRILAPKSGVLRKLVVFCPESSADLVRNALFEAGAGAIGKYDQCSFNLSGSGTFRASEGAVPFVGKVGEMHREPEVRIEVIFPEYLQNKVLERMRAVHPYEEVAYDLYALMNENQEVGSGLVGNLTQPMAPLDFLKMVKQQMKTDCIRYTGLTGKLVSKVALCGGSGSFLLNAAINSGADAYVSADFKYHEFFDAEDKLIIADIGHYESEQFTMELLHDFLTENFATFAVRLTTVNTNPLNYF